MKAQSRRDFIRTSTVLAGSALLAPWAISNSVAAATKRTAIDQVTLGKTGIQLSRLGMGTGSTNGFEQKALGKDGFTKLVHYAYDQGITYFDTAQRYATYEWIGDAIKGLPREKLYIQSKLPDKPEDVLEAIDRQRKVFKTDYIDSLLIHCMTRGNWADADQWKRIMDGFDAAKEKKWIRAKGVSCHSLPALKTAVASDWTEVHLVRVNPQGKFMDGIQGVWGEESTDTVPVMEQIKTMREKGHGVIGMKIFGNGTFKDPADREKSVRYAMNCKEIDAIVIGFTETSQVDETIKLINRVLAEA